MNSCSLLDKIISYIQSDFSIGFSATYKSLYNDLSHASVLQLFNDSCQVEIFLKINVTVSNSEVFRF